MSINLGKLLGSGARTAVYEYGNDKVFKLYLENTGIDSVKYEYDKTLDAHNNGLPTPKVYEIIEHNGHFGLVMERIQGITLNDDSQNNIKNCIKSGASQQEISQSIYNYEVNQIKKLVAILYNLHKKTCKLKTNAKNTLAWHCSNNNYINQDEKKIILKIIEDLPDSNHVCHGDPNLKNFIINNSEIRIIDWVDCANAHPFLDITEYKLSNEYSDNDLSGVPKYLVDLYYQFKSDNFKIFIEEYVRLSGIDLSGLDSWTIPILVHKMYGNHSEQRQQRLLDGIKNGLKCL